MMYPPYKPWLPANSSGLLRGPEAGYLASGGPCLEPILLLQNNLDQVTRGDAIAETRYYPCESNRRSLGLAGLSFGVPVGCTY
jgi:hypothetical protein